MNELAIFHAPETQYCFAYRQNIIRVRLRIDKNDNPQKIEVVYGGKYDFSTKQKSCKMKRQYEDRLYAYYVGEIHLKDVRFVYVFKIYDHQNIYYYSEDGLTDSYDYTLSYFNCFQFAYIFSEDVQKPVKWMGKAVFYQIFVDRFAQGIFTKNLQYINLPWGEKPTPKSFAGGDLKGIYDHLDDIQNLGITAIYLTPIFTSKSNHKYDTSNYFEIDSHFGDKKVFLQLVNEIHRRNMKIVLDAVFNHCSEDFPPFIDAKERKEESPYYHWFIFHENDYETFAHCTYMPKFNTENPDVQDYLLGIIEYWMKEFHIDGWRLDVSDEVAHSFWKRFRKRVKEINDQCVILGENWHDAHPYLLGDQYDGIMNYAFTKSCIDFFAKKRLTSVEMANKLSSILMRNNDIVNQMMLNLLDSHDTIRFITYVHGNENILLEVLALMFFFVGSPCIYYGTEIGLEGEYDPDSRRTMDWEKATKNGKIKETIKKLSELKKEGLLSGDNIKILSEDNMLIITRENKKDCLRLIINESNESKVINPNTLVISSLYQNGRIEKHGFLIERKTKEENK